MTELFASDPEYQEIDLHQRLLCLFLNAHMWHGVNDLAIMPDDEQAVLRTKIEGALDDALKHVLPDIFKEWADEEM